MSDTKNCDYCGKVINIQGSPYYKCVVEYTVNNEVANYFHNVDICVECFKKGVIIKEEK